MPTWPSRASACWWPRGGKGGLGNAFYATSTNRAPRKSQPGLPGEARRLRLHLKLLADVGLVGYPNAGKSTLISRISAAKPKIADYPFTTLTPNLGVVLMRDDRSFVVADVPGLIEGAHTGHGLGDRFLKHLERTKVLIVLVDVSGLSGRAPADDLDVLRRELALFDAGLGSKPQLVAANKMDAATDESLVASLEARARELELPFFRISAVAGTGLQPLLEAAWAVLAEARAAQKATLDLTQRLNPSNFVICNRQSAICNDMILLFSLKDVEHRPHRPSRWHLRPVPSRTSGGGAGRRRGPGSRRRPI